MGKILGASCTLVLACAAPAQEHDAASHAGGLGDVSFENTGAPAAQLPFFRGLALLHSFEYDEAAEAFRAAQGADPGFAMAYWGEALTYAHLLWGEDDATAARAALARLAATPEVRLARAGSARERAYGAAVEAFYTDSDLAPRVRAYADSMRSVAAAYPDDIDALAFAALAVMFSAYVGELPAEDIRLARAEAIAFAERAYAAAPTHPGAVHYLIHATDDPDFATRGEAAARTYAAIAPDAEHALHMPSHIFLQLGLWDDVVATNERSWAASRAEIEERGLTNADLSFHALQWLQYGYLQQGRYRDARALIDTARAVLNGVDLSDASHADARYAVSDLDFVWAQNTGDWKTGACSNVRVPDIGTAPVSAREQSFRSAALVQAAIAEMRCTGAEGEASRSARAALTGEAAPAPPVQRLLALLDAVALQAAGDHGGAIAVLTPLARAPTRPPVGPPYLPRVHELLAASLMSQGRPQDAVAQLEHALTLTPNRAAALIALARAHAATGSADDAATAYGQLLKNWHRADRDLPVLAEARQALAQ